MPVDLFPQKSVEDLTIMLESLQKRATEGLVFFTTGIGIQQQKSFQGADRCAVAIRQVLYSLHLKDPNTFGDPYASRIRRTRARYTCS